MAPSHSRWRSSPQRCSSVIAQSAVGWVCSGRTTTATMWSLIKVRTIPTFIFGKTDSLEFDNVFAITGVFIFFIYVLITYSTLFHFYPKRKWLMCLLGILLSFVIVIPLRYFLEQVLTEYLFELSNYNRKFTFRAYVIDNYFFGARYVSIAVIYYLVCFNRYTQNREKDIILEKQQIEISTLNAQVNPHFLLNSMNSIYSLVYHKSDKALGAVDKLSDILKYNLYEKKDFVSVKKELEIANQFLALQQLRHDFPIAFKIESSIEDTVVIPQLLILTMVENAFKHGVLNDPKTPIKLLMKKSNGRIELRCENKKSTTLVKDKIGGIGLVNMKNRLKLMYQGKATFDIEDETDYFSIFVTIPTSD